jgi:hypothetical protein
MGLLKHLLFWPVTGPEFLIKFSLGKVEQTVREELVDDQAVKESLLALQMRLELGEIDDDEYMEQEAELMQRLRDVRYWREQFGMGTSGGPVQVVREEAPVVDDTPDVAETLAAASLDEEVEDEEPPRGGIASPEGATIEFNFDWEEEE